MFLMQSIRRGSVALLFGFGMTVLAQAGVQTDRPLEARRDALNKLLAEQWEYQLKESPEWATIYGDLRYNDKMSDSSLKHLRESAEDSRKWLARFEAVDTSGFPDQEQLNKSLMVLKLKERIESYELKLWEMPVNQFSGIHLQIAQFVPLIPFGTTKDYEGYIARLKAMPKVLDDTIEICELGRNDKLMPPKFLLEKVPGQARAIEKPAGDASVFAEPFKKFPANVSTTDQKRLHDEAIQVIDTQLRPAYSRFADYVEKTYAPAGRTEMGMWSLPSGDTQYRYMIKTNTTTNMDPDAIHQLGLSEVKRIEAE